MLTAKLRIVTMAIMIACLAPCRPAVAEQDFADPDQAVEAGKDSLDAQWLPWYDSKADDFKPVNLPKPPSGFWKWLENLFSGWNLDLGELFTFLGWLVVAGLLTAIIIAVIRAYSQADSMAANQTAQEFDAQAHLERVEALPVALEESIRDFRQAARKAYEAGDLNKAIVYLFSHELIELDRRALLRLVKGKTNRQYLRELRRNAPEQPRLGQILEQTILLFEAAFFGAHPPDRPAFEARWADSEEFDRLLAPAERAA